MLIQLIENLVGFQGISPDDGGAIDFLNGTIDSLGFHVKVIHSKKTKSIYAKLLPHRKVDVCFAGHVDVVSPGKISDWTFDPFEARILDNRIYGRGIVDMKSAICCFISAVSEFLSINSDGSLNIGIILTSDEETTGDGMREVIEYLTQNNEEIVETIVGEPTCENKIGDTIKIGRRGSINFEVSVNGKSGHVAYPHLARNPLDCVIKSLSKLMEYSFDDGNKHFSRSNCEITNINVGNSFNNVIPGGAVVNFNIRFNDIHTVESLNEIVCGIFAMSGFDINVKHKKNPALPFLTKNSNLIRRFSHIVKNITGITPSTSTGGGTSDARFLKDITSVIEFGLLNKTAHQVNENSPLDDIYLLKDIYKEFIVSCT